MKGIPKMLKFIKYISTVLICASIGLGYLFSDNLSFADNIKYTEEKLKNVFSKNYLMKGETSSDFWEISALADGTLELSVSNGYSDYGKWWIEGNTWCRKFDEARNSVTSCYTIQHVKDNKYLIEKTKGNGVDKTTVTID